jgi:hypothetical protein
MGILTDILGGLARAAVNVTIAGGGALARVTRQLADAAKPKIIAAVQAMRDSWRELREKRALASSNSPSDVTEELRDINEQLARLGAKQRRHGSLTTEEMSRADDLKQRRVTLLDDLRAVDELRIAEKITDSADDYAGVTISDDSTHLLQSTVGQTLYGKPCPVCRRPMRLQWMRGKETIGVADLGWACTGWYWRANGSPHKCQHWEPLKSEDHDLFAAANRPAFAELKPQQFADLVLGHSDFVIKRLDDVRLDRSTANSVEAYRCPIHGEPLVLRQKKDHNGSLLDMYFLGCARWKYDGNGCHYLEKLKSPAQLHGYLEAATGTGII